MDELHRYIEYLQRQTITVWSERVSDRHVLAEWAKNPTKLEELAAQVGGGEALVHQLESVLSSAPEAASEFESPIARRIFTPLLDDVLSAATELQVGVEREVIFANATDTHPTSSSVPSSHKHLVFAGAGTYVFCNYWAKVVANVAYAYNKEFEGVPITRKRLRQLWPINVDLIATPLRLAVYCRLLGTVLGFGRIPTLPEQTGFRVELLSAMETFALAHEVGHCFIEERNPGQLITADDELFCDIYSFAISRAIGTRRDNWSMISGAGAYTFLRAAAVSLPKSQRDGVATHPDSEHRAAVMFELATEGMSRRRGAPIRRYLREVDALFAEIERHRQMVWLPP